MTTMETYTVIYRVGGYVLFKWCECLPVRTIKEALKLKAEIELQGYRAVVCKTQDLANGLPKTYEFGGEN